MKACNQKKCLHYDLSGFGNCDNKTMFEKCGAKDYKGNRVITQMDMNEIIDKMAGWYPESIFRETTIKETNEFSQVYVKKYMSRVAASMARLTCENIKKELEKHFEEN